MGLALLAGLSAAPEKQTFTGIVTDTMCADADHSRMRMGPTDAECALACHQEHDALYVLYDGNKSYTLSGPKTLEKFAGKKVTVTGVLNTTTMTIAVDSLTLN
jgi:hypothetical protein